MSPELAALKAEYEAAKVVQATAEVFGPAWREAANTCSRTLNAARDLTGRHKPFDEVGEAWHATTPTGKKAGPIVRVKR